MEPEDSLPCSHEPVSVLGQSNPVCATSHFLQIHFNIILPFVLRSYKWPLSLKSPLRTCPLSHTCYMPRSSRSSWVDNPHDICWVVHHIQLLLMQLCAVSCYLVPFRPKYLPQHPILEHPQPTSLSVGRRICTPAQNSRKNYSYEYLNFYFFLLQIDRQIENFNSLA